MSNKIDFSFHKLLGEVIRLHFSLSHKTLEKEGLYPGQPPLLYALYDNSKTVKLFQLQFLSRHLARSSNSSERFSGVLGET